MKLHDDDEFTQKLRYEENNFHTYEAFQERRETTPGSHAGGGGGEGGVRTWFQSHNMIL